MITEKETSLKATIQKRVISQVQKYWRITKYVTPYWQFKAVMVFIIVSTILEVITPTLIGNTIDIIRVIENKGALDALNEGYIRSVLVSVARWLSDYSGFDIRYVTVGVFVTCIVLIAAIVALINYVIRYGTAYYSQKGSYMMRRELYNHLLDQSFSFYDKQKTGQLMAKRARAWSV